MGMMRTIFVNGIAVGEVPQTGDELEDLRVAREFLAARGLVPEVSSFRAIQGQAIAFAYAANAVYEQYLNTTPARNGLAAVPFVVNSAFSIELYLKTLHEIAGTPQRGHRLLTLFDALPADVRAELEAAAIANAPAYLGPRHAERSFSLRDFVTDLDNSFVEWRYWHEQGGGTGKVMLHPTILVMKALHDVTQSALSRIEQQDGGPSHAGG